MRRAAVAAIGVAAALAPAPVSAQTKQECVDAYTQGQVSRRAGKLRDARAKFDVCATASCPAPLRRDCVPWSDELDREIPAIVVRVIDPRGQVVDGARLTLDGAATPNDGAAQKLDPGDHVVKAEAAGFSTGEARFKLSSGDRSHDVTVRLAPDAASARPAGEVDGPRRPIPTLSYVFLSGAVVGVGAFIVLGAVGSGKKGDLDASGCKPTCAQGDVDAIKTDYIGADVALGLGAASLAAATFFFLTRPAADPAPLTADVLPLGWHGAAARATWRF